MNKLYQILCKIQNSPEEYLDGRIGLSRLGLFANGFIAGERSHGIIENLLDDNFSRFVKTYWKDTGNFNWSTCLRRITGSDKEAFYRFYQTLDAYCKETPQMLETHGEDIPLRLDPKNLTVKPLFTCLDQIRGCPGMWLGDNTGERLYFFIRGFMTAETVLYGEEDLYGHPFDGPPYEFFTNYVRESFHIKENVSWLRIVMFKSAMEADEIKNFYSLLDQYRERL